MKIAGPIPAIDNPDPGDAGYTGSMLVVEFESIEAARSWAGADPYVAAGVYQSIEVHPYKPVLP